MTQQERLKKIFEENASITSNRNNYMNEDTFLRVASELIIKLMKSMKPRSRKQGRMIRKAEKLMKYPTLIGYGE